LVNALKEPDVEVIYLLSDGEPTHGITRTEQIVNDVVKANSMRSVGVQIHTVAFLMGGTHDSPRPRKLLASIAAATGGVFRCVDPHAPDDEEHGDFLDDESSFTDADAAEFQQYFANRMAAIPQSAYDLCNKATLLSDMPPPPNWKGNLIARPRTAAEVVVSKVEAQKNHGHHIYDVDVVLKDVVPTKAISWTVAKTFTDFKRLHNKVKSLLDNNVTPFPPDPMFHNHDAAFLQQRKNLLEKYIQALYITLGPFANGDLNEFLLFDANVDEAIAEAIDIGQAHYLAQMQAQGKGLFPPPNMQPPPSAAPPGYPLPGPTQFNSNVPQPYPPYSMPQGGYYSNGNVNSNGYAMGMPPQSPVPPGYPLPVQSNSNAPQPLSPYSFHSSPPPQGR